MACEPCEFTWTDSAEQVTVVVPLRGNIAMTDCRVKMSAVALRLKFRGQDPVIDGDLWKACLPDESVWWIQKHSGKYLFIMKIQKETTEVAWERLLR
mmetsp:Transcript_93126/g.216420  ORF Transcript_93126/g.216420 Transcript_93126/m.216420 type:complete len:97 (+) Transcript_93126:113-403(+)